MAFSGNTNKVALYEMATGTEYKVLETAARAISPLAFSSDTRILAAGDWDGYSVHLWELATGQEIEQFAGHTGRIFHMAFSADGKQLLTGSEDTTALLWDMTGRHGKPAASHLSAEEANACWAELASSDAARAFRARWRLASSPCEAVTLLRNYLRPVREADAQKLPRLLAELGSTQFVVRAKAQTDLEALGELAEPALREALTANPTLEVRQRLQRLLDRMHATAPPSDVLQSMRAIAVLEDIATPAARDVLQTLAAGAPVVRLTREAQASLDRLAKRATVATP